MDTDIGFVRAAAEMRYQAILASPTYLTLQLAI